MEDDLNGRRPQWKTTSMEDDLNGRQPQYKTTSMEDDLKMNSIEDDLNKNEVNGRPQLKTPSIYSNVQYD